MTRQTKLLESVMCSCVLPTNCYLAIFPSMTPMLSVAEFVLLSNKYISCSLVSSQFAVKLPMMSSYVLTRKGKLQ